MAKRKRLAPAEVRATSPETEGATGATGVTGAAPETKSIGAYPLGLEPAAPRRAPIAQVAGEAAAQAALQEVADELHSAKSKGRMVLDIPLDAIDVDHLVRDRMNIDPGDMDALMASLRARGQQTPIEVVDLGQGRYGLISGWRRLRAIRALHEVSEAGEFAAIQALIRRIDTATESYIAMVEENEIRADLSFYERARLSCEAARLGLYPTAGAAVQALFARARSAKRSKINSFVTVHEALGDVLCFPAAIPERLGLLLAAGLQADPGFGARLKDSLRKTPPPDAGAERTALERALRKTTPAKPSQGDEVAPDVFLQAKAGRVVLTGKGVTAQLRQDLVKWLGQV